ncbi:MAG: hypothetical protein ACOCP4_06715 [Candidatus Woesearchaeota archaeon]
MRFKKYLFILFFFVLFSLSSYSVSPDSYSGFNENLKYYSFYFNQSYGLLQISFNEIAGYNSNYVFLVQNKTDSLIDVERLSIGSIRNRNYLYDLPRQNDYEIFLFSNNLISRDIFFNTSDSNLDMNFLVLNPTNDYLDLDLSYLCKGLSEREGDKIELDSERYSIEPQHIKIIESERKIDYPNHYDCNFNISYRDDEESFSHSFVKLAKKAENIDIHLLPKSYGFEIYLENYNNVSTVVDLYFTKSDNVDIFPDQKQVALAESSSRNIDFYVFPKTDNLNQTDINVVIDNFNYQIYNETISVEFSRVFRENSLITFIVLIFFALVLFLVSLLINYPTKNGEKNENKEN